jgi:lipoate-protein ligase A
VAAPTEVELLRGGLGGEPALEVALAHALLDDVARGERGPTLRIYEPRPTVAFGRRDALLPGFGAAAGAAQSHAFTPVVRAPGGRAAVYAEGCLVIDELWPQRDSTIGISDRFADDATRAAAVLRELGVDARIGEIPGEYCPGAFTVNARGVHKLIGAAQRVVRGAWLLSSVVVVDGADRLRAVLVDVYRELGLEWDPSTVGSIAAERPGITVADVEAALLAGYAERYTLEAGSLASVTRTAALGLVDAHRVEV